MVTPTVKKRRPTKRDSKGLWIKGTGGGPGRTRVPTKDVLGSPEKRQSMEQLISDLLKTYGRMGGQKFLYKWAVASKGNLKKFIEIVFKFAKEHEERGADAYEIDEIFLPQTKVTKGMKVPPRSDIRIHDLEDDVKERDEEIRRLKKILKDEGVDSDKPVVSSGEIEHEPVRAVELPEHVEKKKHEHEPRPLGIITVTDVEDEREKEDE